MLLEREVKLPRFLDNDVPEWNWSPAALLFFAVAMLSTLSLGFNGMFLWGTPGPGASPTAEGPVQNQTAPRLAVASASSVAYDPVHCPPFLIFSIPRSYQGVIAECQDIALRNWRRLQPKPRIWMFASPQSATGAKEHIRGVDVRLIQNFTLNEYGVPFLADPFRMAGESGLPVLVYSNSDLLYASNFTSIIAQLWARFKGVEFFAIGRRNDIMRSRDLRNARTLDTFEEVLAAMPRKKRHANWVDYLIYTPGVFKEALPPLTVGRDYFDWWLLYYAARQPDVQVIDMNNHPLVYHVRHGYGHVSSNSKYQMKWTQEMRSRNQAPDSGRNKGIFLAEVEREVPRLSNETDDEYFDRWRFGMHKGEALPLPSSLHMWTVIACPKPYNSRRCLIANPKTINNKTRHFFLSRTRLLRNAHANQRCALLSRSSEVTDWTELASMTLFAYSPSVLRKPPVRVHYFYQHDVDLVKPVAPRVLNSPSIKLLPMTPQMMAVHREHINNTYWFLPGNESDALHFSSDPPRGLQHRESAPYALLQLTFWMGCKEVYLVDMRSGMRETDGVASMQRLLSVAQRKYAKAGRAIYDATVDGAWKIFPRRSLSTSVVAGPMLQRASVSKSDMIS